MASIQVEKIVQKYGRDSSFLIPILQDVQEEWKYLPEDALKDVASQLSISLGQVYSVATFYKAFSLEPQGKHLIHVCMGTACHVRGALRILEGLERKLDVPEGKTTTDGNFTLKRVNCLGSCALGPLVTIDDDYYGRATQAKLNKAVDTYVGGKDKKVVKAPAKKDGGKKAQARKK